MRKRPTAIFVLGALLALVSACGQAKAGTALPKGDDAADYVGAKFEQVIGKLGDAITDTRDVTNSLDAYFKFDDKWIHSTVTSARTGSPESRAVRHRSQKNPDEIIDTYTPADGAVEYTYLGPVYVQKGVSPTAWVSMPKPEGGLVLPCAWGGVLTPCRMADSAVQAYEADKRAVRGAKSLGDGKTALTVNVPFEIFVKNKVEILPPSITGQVGPELKKAAVPATITLNPDGSLVSFAMEAKFAGDGHQVELKYEFRFTGKASLQDMPKLPDAGQITVLPDRAAMDEFYRRLGEAQGS
ncbi:hypothetical protein Q5425_00020 [Amycolatopsis sp. A133]|jgi:hypothetical protein|uniref:hypothetical protein n=1 Tax=Amycolatopsis sp. A133 TaxID=3064472 RepID=UPI0027F467DA|nr:hypothetical protein [Amycolatopsis sp. A133]MDQ7802096.1 hypothetical protein [Amycolatopsis sp. A133]